MEGVGPPMARTTSVVTVRIGHRLTDDETMEMRAQVIPFYVMYHLEQYTDVDVKCPDGGDDVREAQLVMDMFPDDAMWYRVTCYRSLLVAPPVPGILQVDVAAVYAAMGVRGPDLPRLEAEEMQAALRLEVRDGGVVCHGCVSMACHGPPAGVIAQAHALLREREPQCVQILQRLMQPLQ